MKSEFVNGVTRAFGKVGLSLKKHSPEILLVVGVVGTVASTVMACKATTKVKDILEETKEQVDQVHEVLESDEISEEEYSVEDSKKDLAIIYAQTGLKFVKLYGPSLAVGALSLISILTSHKMLRARNLALATAYTAATKAFKDYRGRVVDRFGKELDRELRYNIKAKEIEEVVVNEDGTETTVTTTVNVADPNAFSIYSIAFCEGNNGWTKDPELNKVFLLQTQNYANDKLKSRGWISLNEVYDMLGAPRTKNGALAGWVYTDDSSAGDNFVDFGIFDIYNNPKAGDFLNGRERSIILDFNCIGNVLDYV